MRAQVLDWAGTLARVQDDYREAIALHEQALAIYRAENDPHGIALALTSLGAVARQLRIGSDEHVVHDRRVVDVVGEVELRAAGAIDAEPVALHA